MRVAGFTFIGATPDTLIRRARYGGRKGRSARRRYLAGIYKMRDDDGYAYMMKVGGWSPASLPSSPTGNPDGQG